jgi:signal transduction histidine kinase
MVVVLSWPAVLSGLSVVVSLYLLRRVWPYRDRPGGRLFVVLVGAIVLWAGTYAVALTVFDPALRRLFEGPLWLAVNGTALSFFAFSLAYTGRTHLLRSTVMGVLVVTLTASVVVVATAPIHDLVQTNYTVEPVFGAAAVTYDRGAWFYGTVVLDYLLVTLSVLLLLDTVLSYGQDYRRQALAVALSPLPVVLVGLPWLFRIGSWWQLNLMAATFPFHLALDLYALFQARMFVLTPGVRRAGERAAIDDLGSAVVLVDDDERVITLNAEAARVLGVAQEDVLATPFADLIGIELERATTDDVTIRVDGMDRRYTVTASQFTDARGVAVGRTVVLQDVTSERRREQRLTVLNRVLRHNLRNDLTVVRGHAELVASQVDDPALRDHAETVIDETDGLVALGEKARTFEAVVGDETTWKPTSLEAVVRDVVGETRREYPEATVSLDVPTDVRVETNADTVRLAVGELLENAIVHGGDGAGAVVGLVPDPEDGSAAVTVADEGPGIPDQEIAVLGNESETDLQHASGIGLWLVHWGVAALGGTVTFDADDGTTARVRLPETNESSEQ